jgi:hypothetical protein
MSATGKENDIEAVADVLSDVTSQKKPRNRRGKNSNKKKKAKKGDRSREVSDESGDDDESPKVCNDEPPRSPIAADSIAHSLLSPVEESPMSTGAPLLVTSAEPTPERSPPLAESPVQIPIVLEAPKIDKPICIPTSIPGLEVNEIAVADEATDEPEGDEDLANERVYLLSGRKIPAPEAAKEAEDDAEIVSDEDDKDDQINESHDYGGREGLNPMMHRLLTSNQLAHLMKTRPGDEFGEESMSSDDDTHDEPEISANDFEDDTYEDDDFEDEEEGDAEPYVPFEGTADEIRERYTVAFIGLARMRALGKVSSEESGAVKDMLLRGDPKIMRAIDKFMLDEDFEQLIDALQRIASRVVVA